MRSFLAAHSLIRNTCLHSCLSFIGITHGSRRWLSCCLRNSMSLLDLNFKLSILGMNALRLRCRLAVIMQIVSIGTLHNMIKIHLPAFIIHRRPLSLSSRPRNSHIMMHLGTCRTKKRLSFNHLIQSLVILHDNELIDR